MVRDVREELQDRDEPMDSEEDQQRYEALVSKCSGQEATYVGNDLASRAVVDSGDERYHIDEDPDGNAYIDARRKRG